MLPFSSTPQVFFFIFFKVTHTTASLSPSRWVCQLPSREVVAMAIPPRLSHGSHTPPSPRTGRSFWLTGTGMASGGAGDVAMGPSATALAFRLSAAFARNPRFSDGAIVVTTPQSNPAPFDQPHAVLTTLQPEIQHRRHRTSTLDQRHLLSHTSSLASHLTTPAQKSEWSATRTPTLAGERAGARV